VVADAAPGAGTRPPGPAGAPGPGLGATLSSVGARRTVGALALVALTALLLAWGPDARLRGLWFDFCQRLAPRVRLSGPAVIVAVDEPSLARYSQWPWPRQRLAKLVDRLQRAKPAAVGLNLLFPEADGFSGASLATRLPGLAARTAAWVASVPDGDHALGQALGAVPSVIGLAGLDGPAAVTPRGHFTPVFVRGQDPSGHVRRYRTALRSVPDIDGGATGHALLSADVSGGVVRRLPLVAAVGDTLVWEPARSEPARLVADLVAAVRTFREPFEPADDLTLLGVQWLGPTDAAGPGDAGISAR
jgi:CHASE2 domain-containing sensor protein